MKVQSVVNGKGKTQTLKPDLYLYKSLIDHTLVFRSLVNVNVNVS
jgi:hypothetical protein